jgi:CRP/FNR family cyclic AMP-dependent transcriptional regulator
MGPMTQTLCALLTQTWFAADMPEDICERLSAIADLREYPTGAAVVQEGEACRELGVILHGRIALRLALPGVGEQTILTIDDGDLFGWSALLPESIATSTGVTLSPTTPLVFDREPLMTLMTADCQIASVIYPRVLVAVTRRLQATRTQLLDLYRPGHEPW